MDVQAFSNNAMQVSPVLSWATEKVLLLRSVEAAADTQAEEVLHWFQSTKMMGFAEVRELVPAADSLAIILREEGVVSDELLFFLTELPKKKFAPHFLTPDLNETLEVPVRYGKDNGPDLVDIARSKNLSIDDVIALHTSATYRVAFIGFAPGFGYLLGLPPQLATPRRQQPRVEVRQGSIAIGGSFTGIYPQNLPGGWNIIGHTSTPIWNIENDIPTLLSPGRKVRFRAI